MQRYPTLKEISEGLVRDAVLNQLSEDELASLADAEQRGKANTLVGLFHGTVLEATPAEWKNVTCRKGEPVKGQLVDLFWSEQDVGGSLLLIRNPLPTAKVYRYLSDIPEGPVKDATKAGLEYYEKEDQCDLLDIYGGYIFHVTDEQEVKELLTRIAPIVSDVDWEEGLTEMWMPDSEGLGPSFFVCTEQLLRITNG